MEANIDLSIVIPAFNEEKRILSTLESLRSFCHETADPLLKSVEVIVVCDGCTDRTEQVVLDWSGCPEPRVLSYPDNRGKGHAVKLGILRSRGRIVAFMDADGSTPVPELVPLAAPIIHGDADVVIGSRRAEGATIQERQPLSRRLLGRAFSLYNRVVLGIPFLDTQCGFKLFRGTPGRELFRDIHCTGFGFDLEVLVAARTRSLRVVEIGVQWNDVPGSTVSPVADGLRMLWSAWRLRGRGRNHVENQDMPSPPVSKSRGQCFRGASRPEETYHA